MKEFFAYVRACGYGNVRYSKRGFWNLEMVLILISGLLVAGIIGCLNNFADAETAGSRLSGQIFVYAALYMYLISLMLGTTRRYSPSILNLAPLSYKKRAVFAHLAVLLFTLLFSAAWACFMFAGILFFSLLTLIFTGDWAFLPTFENNAGLTVAPDAQGVLFVILLFILLFGAGMAISYIRNKKVRYSMLFVFPAGLGAFELLAVNLSASDGTFVIANNMLLYFSNLPLSWLWLVALAVIALGICAVSVFLALKNEKPKDY